VNSATTTYGMVHAAARNSLATSGLNFSPAISGLKFQQRSRLPFAFAQRDNKTRTFHIVTKFR
jgi:hypothetical protein